MGAYEGQVGCGAGPGLRCGVSPCDGGHLRGPSAACDFCWKDRCHNGCFRPLPCPWWRHPGGQPCACRCTRWRASGARCSLSAGSCATGSSQDAQAGALCARQASGGPGRVNEGGIADRASTCGQTLGPEALSWCMREAQGRPTYGRPCGPQPDFSGRSGRADERADQRQRCQPRLGQDGVTLTQRRHSPLSATTFFPRVLEPCELPCLWLAVPGSPHVLGTPSVLGWGRCCRLRLAWSGQCAARVVGQVVCTRPHVQDSELQVSSGRLPFGFCCALSPREIPNLVPLSSADLGPPWALEVLVSCPRHYQESRSIAAMCHGCSLRGCEAQPCLPALPRACCSSSGLGPPSFKVLGCPLGLEVVRHRNRPAISIMPSQAGGRERERGISVALGCSPLLSAVPCSSAAHCTMGEWCPFCSCVCRVLLAWVVPAARSVLGVLFTCLLAALYCKASGRSLLRRTRAQAESAPIVCRIIFCLGAVASPACPILSWKPRANSIRPTSRPPTIGLRARAWHVLVRFLAFGCLPHCVWAAPSGVSDLLAAVDDVETRAPEAMAMSTELPSFSTTARLDDGRTIPSGGDSAEEVPQAGPLSGPGVFLVLCPYHQSTAVTLNIPRPCDVEMVCNLAKGSLGTLQLEFARDVLPTVPQVDRLFGSLVVAPGWLRAADVEIVVWDL